MSDPFAASLERIAELLPRYAIDGPRYTSYPTAPVWTAAYGPDDFRADLADDEIEASDGLSLYVHVPFCDSLCHFCACNKLITPDHTRAAGYLDTIEREIEAVRAATRGPRAATQLPWGGGTPPRLAPAGIQPLFRALTEAVPLRADAEISIEVDPRVTTSEHIEVLAE